MKVVRPRKNGSPQSNWPVSGPPRLSKALLPVRNRDSAFAMLKLTSPDAPFAPRFVAV